jgi:hypothetical protein
LASLIRQIASFETPCSSRALREKTLRYLAGLASPGIADSLEELIETLLVFGDLLELPSRDQAGRGSQLFLTQPSFVRRSSQRVYLLGTPADGLPMLPDAFARRMRYRSHVRFIDAAPDEDLPGLLLDTGLQELPRQLWFTSPRKESPSEAIARYTSRLLQAPPAGNVDTLQVLDAARSNRFYKGRWTNPKGLSGRFVGRREQRYGSPLWCFVELVNGTALRLTDIQPDEWRASDRAWYLQLAIDAERGSPQEFAKGRGDNHDLVVSFFSPLPRWIQMRWEFLATPTKVSGALFSYSLPTSEYPEEKKVLEEFWLRETQSF